MRSDMADHHGQVVDHCTDPAASDFPFLPWRPASDGSLADHPEYVVGYHLQFKDKRIGSKLTRRKPLKIHIRFYLTVELFTLSVGVIQFNNLLVCLLSQVCPSGFNFYIRDSGICPYLSTFRSVTS